MNSHYGFFVILNFDVVNALYYHDIAQSLKCFGPKVEWNGNMQTFPLNQFEIAECDTGMQQCVGGCTFCVNVSGSFVGKSCAGEEDIGLKILGLYSDGCKKVTKSQNINYTNWISKSVGRLPNDTLSADFTIACRCSWDGCNGIQPNSNEMDGGQITSTSNITDTSTSMGRSVAVGYMLAHSSSITELLFHFGLFFISFCIIK